MCAWHAALKGCLTWFGTYREAARCSVSLNISHNSLKITQVHWKWYYSKAWYGFLFALHSNYGRIFSRFAKTHERDRHPAIAVLRNITRLSRAAKIEHWFNRFMTMMMIMMMTMHMFHAATARITVSSCQHSTDHHLSTCQSSRRQYTTDTAHRQTTNVAVFPWRRTAVVCARDQVPGKHSYR